MDSTASENRVIAYNTQIPNAVEDLGISNGIVSCE